MQSFKEAQKQEELKLKGATSSKLDQSSILPTHLKPDALFETSYGAQKAQILATALELRLFDYLAQCKNDSGRSIQDIRGGIGIKSARPEDFLNALVAMGHLVREGKDLESWRYRNSEEANVFCVRESPLYMGQIMHRFANIRENSFGELTKLLKEESTYKIKEFNELYSKHHTSVPEFAHAMESCIKLAVFKLSESILPRLCDQGLETIADIGGGSGYTLMEFCRHNPRIKCAIDCELGELRDTFTEYLGREEKCAGGERLRERVFFQELDFLKEGSFRFKIPGSNMDKVDGIVFGNVMHNWELKVRKELMRKSFESLSKGGKIIIYDYFLDEESSKLPSYLMSLHMQLVCRGSQFTFAEMKGWLEEAGFSEVVIESLDGRMEACIATKK
ncbi:hypothetical protein FGO68_gene13827 [Halteria grandinella]|uniref:O-methyltransferase n=1 Tax=Halteria grandinella TaxID=5974 RepID=A0A8J8NNK2_HALGN|nr:hypothetical protein FGO68_gene13827 [Halteria grandinella]